MPLKYYSHPAFGEIALKKYKRSRGLRIIIRNSNAISVTFPYHLSYNEAIRFIDEKAAWISDSLKKIEQTTQTKTFLPETNFRTFAHELFFEKAAIRDPFIKVDRYKIVVYYSDEQSLHREEVQLLIHKAIEKVLRNEALSYLPPRVDFFANRFNLQYKKIAVKKMKTRWGSCSNSGNLNFNIHLMRLPVHLMDYVILHELAHTKHHNHGPQFWKFLDELSGDAKGKAREMTKYRTSL